MSRREEIIKGAIFYWEQRLKDKVYWWDKSEYSEGFIKEQILYFKNFK